MADAHQRIFSVRQAHGTLPNLNFSGLRNAHISLAMTSCPKSHGNTPEEDVNGGCLVSLQQAAGPNRPPAADRFARPTLGKSRFAPAVAKPQGAEPARQASPQRPAHPNQQQQAPPAVVHRQQEQKVRFIAPPSRLPSPPAAVVALNPNKPAEPAATPAFGGFQSRLPRPGRATPAVTKPAASTAGATPAAALHGGTPETPNVLLWRPGGAADMVTPPAQRLAAGEQTFALFAEAPSSAASGDTPSTGAAVAIFHSCISSAGVMLAALQPLQPSCMEAAYRMRIL